MKKSVLILALLALIVSSCGDKKKEEIKKSDESNIEVPNVKDIEASKKINLGKKLFTAKTCIACHQPTAKVIGPSIIDIVTIYKEKNASIVKFLNGESGVIVDTAAAQVAIMKANIDGFVKDLTQEELEALAAYMESIK